MPSQAQNIPSAAAASAAVPANPADVASMDAILASLYDVISGGAGQKRNWDRFRSLFVPGARLIPTGGPAGQPVTARVWTVEEYVQRAAPGIPWASVTLILTDDAGIRQNVPCDDLRRELAELERERAELRAYLEGGLAEECRRAGCLPGWLR